MLRRLLACPLCGARVAIPADSAVGKRAYCGACGEGFRIPSHALGADDADASADARARTSPCGPPLGFGAFWQADDERLGSAGTLAFGRCSRARDPDTTVAVRPGRSGAPRFGAGDHEATRPEIDLRWLRARFGRTVT